MPLFPTLERQGEVDLFELEAIIVYTVISGPARTTVRFCFKRNKKNNNKKVQNCKSAGRPR